MKLDWYGRPVNVRRLLLLVILPAVVLVAAGALFLPFGFVRLAVMLVLGIPVILFCLDRPTLIFYVTTFIFFSNLDVFTPFRFYRFLLLILIVAFAIALAQGRRPVWHHPVLIALAAAFLIVAFQSLSVARNLDQGILRLGTILKSLVAVALAGQFVRDRSEFRRFLIVVALGMLLSNFLPFAIKPPTSLSDPSVLWAQASFRYEGFAFEPNTFAMFQIFLIPILMILMVLYRKLAVLRLIVPLMILGCIAVLALSFSRGGFVALVVLLGLLIVLERKNRQLLVIGLLFIAVGVVLAPTVYWERVKSIFYFSGGGEQDFTILTRLETMKTAFKLGMSHPILGVGLDNFIYNASRFLPFDLVVHNTLLLIFAELGFVGLGLFAGIVGCNIVVLKRMIERRGDPEASEVGRLLLIQQVAVIVNSFFIPVAYETVFLYLLALPAFADYAYRVMPVSQAEERNPSV